MATTAAPKAVGRGGGAAMPEMRRGLRLVSFMPLFNHALGFHPLNAPMAPEPALPLQQHPNFAAALRRLGQPVRVTALSNAAPVINLRRFGVTFASRGPVWAEDVPCEARWADLQQSGLRLINADTQEPATYKQAGFRMITTPAFVAELDLTETTETRLTHMKAKWRNAWRRAQDASFRTDIRPFALHRHGWLLEADLAQQRRKGFRTLPHAILKAYADCRPHDTIVFTATRKRTPIAAMLFLRHGPVATYHLGWTGAEGRAQNAHHGLLTAAADWLAARGHIRLDLGHVDTETAPGLARFKIGTGAKITPLGGTWLRLPGR
ncbi:GNAT family N-acetyltransferase [Cognatiyoonia sp. IB215182]|uniref:GNAT family N-acetyltransferase n=1 Tax=Cognatiyoonia sp. IB215182 TaxID=3097353 RepID=UPI002A23D50E|nr:GNAT family N-acetyltransferase [Cognatiyoonia sp. IB215182]